MRSEHQPEIVGYCECGSNIYQNKDTGKTQSICSCPPNPIKPEPESLSYLREMKKAMEAKYYITVMEMINDFIEEMEAHV